MSPLPTRPGALSLSFCLCLHSVSQPSRRDRQSFCPGTSPEPPRGERPQGATERVTIDVRPVEGDARPFDAGSRLITPGGVEDCNGPQDSRKRGSEAVRPPRPKTSVAVILTAPAPRPTVPRPLGRRLNAVRRTVSNHSSPEFSKGA